jgi:hypothetical protein
MTIGCANGTTLRARVIITTLTGARRAKISARTWSRIRSRSEHTSGRNLPDK